MSTKTFANVELNNLRFKHFHSKRFNENGEIVNGNLIATIATAELPDNMIAVGISRCNPIDQARRDIGRAKALHRLKRLVAITVNSITDPELLKRESKKHRAITRAARHAELPLAQLLPLDEFIKTFIEANPFHNGALPEDGTEPIDFPAVLIEQDAA